MRQEIICFFLHHVIQMNMHWVFDNPVTHITDKFHVNRNSNGHSANLEMESLSNIPDKECIKRILVTLYFTSLDVN